MQRDPAVRVFDLRSPAEFERFHVAGARQLTPSALRHEPLPSGTTVVLYGNGDARAARASAIVRDRGVDALVLRGGVREWFVRVYEPRLTLNATTVERAEFERAVRFSRFFGGTPLVEVSRTQSVAVPILRGRGC